ncbi:MAG: carotenoid oxygenase family protein [Burkholderiaceae bacterium]
MTASTSSASQPVYLTGFMAPVADEIESTDLEVEGHLPPELSGTYVRNGSNPMPGTDPGHDFTGQGMLHGVRLDGGRALWYRNRWVRTPAMLGAQVRQPDNSMRYENSLANTSVASFDGKVLALVENAYPYEVTPDLDTVGVYRFRNDQLSTSITAHTKLDPTSGELHFYSYSPSPFISYHVATPDGFIRHSQTIPVPGPTMMHDFALTERHVLFLDMPVIFDKTLAAGTPYRFPYRWDDAYRSRIGVLPRSRPDAQVRWYEIEPGYAFHVANAYEDGHGRIVLDAVNYDRQAFNSLWAGIGGVSVLKGVDARQPLRGGSMYRWVIDPRSERVSEQRLDDLEVEFPVIHPGRIGRAYRYAYSAAAQLAVPSQGSFYARNDMKTGERQVYRLDDGWIPGEASFVPASGACAEEEGWLLTLVTHARDDAARLLVLDASRLESGPVATVKLPRRVPIGFHGAWIPMKD